MMPNEVLNHAKRIFPQMFEDDYVWFPHGKNSVRIRAGRQREVIFVYRGENNWSKETADHYFDRLKGEDKK